MHRWVKRLMYVVGGIVGVALITAAGVYGYSESRFRKHYDVPATPLRITSDSVMIARGEQIATTFGGCTECHGDNLGGKVVIDNPPIGTVYAANITKGKGGRGALMTDADFARSIRHGVASDGRPLKVMPSIDFIHFSAEDLAAVIAYVKSRPPVDNEVPPIRIGPVGRALFAAGKLPFLSAELIDHSSPMPAAVAVGGTLEYGAYIASVGCKGCHGPALAGGPIAGGDPNWPPAANLTPAGATKDWSEPDFVRLWRSGKRPNGIPVNDVMPWKVTNKMSDTDLHALYLYIKSIPAVPTGGTAPAQTAMKS